MSVYNGSTLGILKLCRIHNTVQHKLFSHRKETKIIVIYTREILSAAVKYLYIPVKIIGYWAMTEEIYMWTEHNVICVQFLATQTIRFG
jgi:hypothetical protein